MIRFWSTEYLIKKKEMNDWSDYLSSLISPHSADTGFFLKYYQAAARYRKSGNFHENFIFVNCVKRHICDVKIRD